MSAEKPNRVNSRSPQAIKSAVETGEAPSTHVFVDEAVRERLRECRRARIYAAYEEAARDSEYLQAIDADMAAFETSAG